MGKKIQSAIQESGMRVAILSPTYPPAICGVGDHTHFLSQQLIKEDFEVTVITSARKVINSDGIDVRATVGNWHKDEMENILEAVIESNSDIAILQYVPQAYGKAGAGVWLAEMMSSLRQSGILTLVHFHEIYSPLSLSPRQVLRSIAHIHQARIIARSADICVATTSQRKHYLEKIASRDASVIDLPVGTNIPIMQFDKKIIKKIRSQYLRNDNGILIGSFGTLMAEERSYRLLIRSLSILENEFPDSHFVWIGKVDKECTAFRKIQHYIKRQRLTNRITWTGKLEPEIVSACLSALDIFIFLNNDGPCFRHGSLTAAMAHGLPIVAIQGASADQRFVDRENILLCNSNPESMAKAIMQLVNSEELRRRMGTRAMELYERDLTWQAIAKKLIDCLESKLGANKNAA